MRPDRGFKSFPRPTQGSGSLRLTWKSGGREISWGSGRPVYLNFVSLILSEMEN